MAIHAQINLSSGAAVKHLPQATSGLWEDFLSALHRIHVKYAENRKAAADVKILMSYDDRLLKDIGINRADIERRVMGRSR